jgi:FkbM family methyltransferase
LSERRLPTRLEHVRDRFCQLVGLRHKTVIASGLRLRVRRLTCDEAFVYNVLEESEYDPAGYEVCSGDVVVDVGANIGTYTLKAARTARVVYAVEPDAENFALLAENVRRNRLSGQIVPIRAAIAAHSGTITLHKSGEGGYHSVVATRAHGWPTEDVAAISLTDLFDRFGIEHCDVLKLDCEGAEYEALYALRETFWRKIGRVVMEYHGVGRNPEEDQRLAHELVTYLEAQGFRIDCYERFGGAFRGGHVRATRQDSHSQSVLAHRMR